MHEMGSEEIGMCPVPDQVQVVDVHLVHQQTVRFNVAVAVMTPVAAEWVILVPGR